MSEIFIEKMLPKESRAFIDFSSKDEYLQAMVEDLSDWLNYLYNLKGESLLNLDNFFRLLKNGVILCKHAQVIQSVAEVYLKSSSGKGRCLPMKIGNQSLTVPLQPPKCSIVDFSKAIASFHERDNVSNFIAWCKQFNIPENLTFETEDLVSLKNPRNVVVALLEISRIGRLFGMEVPDIIQLEQEIEDEINEINESANNDENSDFYGSSDCDISSCNVMEHDVEYNNGDIYDRDCLDLCSHDIKEISILEESDVEYKNVEENTSEKMLSENESKRDDKNVSVDPNHLSASLGVDKSFGFKGRRFSANLSSRDFLSKISKIDCVTNILTSPSNGDCNNPCNKLRNQTDKIVIRKSQSVIFNDDGSVSMGFVDSSDNESNFSQTSRSDFRIPKHNTAKPVGRVKIYDNFNKLNYVKEKKTREKVDLRSLDERVREVLSQCQCKEMFLMKRISEGKYQYGDKNTRIFVRILRTHVMVRVGGGWDTLGDFFFKHDPCRKEKSDNYKFFLPALNKKAHKMINDNTLVLEQSATCPSNNAEFKQGMIEVKKSSLKNKSDCDKEVSIFKEDNNEKEVIKEESTPTIQQVTKDKQVFQGQGLEKIIIVEKGSNEREGNVDKENFNESSSTTKSELAEEEIYDILEETNNNINMTDTASKSSIATRDDAVVMRRSPFIIDYIQRRRGSLNVVRNNSVKNSLIIPNKLQIRKAASKIPKPTFQSRK